MSRYSLPVVFLVVLAVSGCFRSGPADLPRLYPCSITVQQEGKPLEQAVVQLVAADGSQKWHPLGSSDPQGTARMNTNGVYPGAPAGTYKIVVSKVQQSESKLGPEPPLESPEHEAWLQKKGAENLDAFSLIELKYTKPGETPLEIEVKKQRANTLLVDVGKAVKIKIQP